MAIEIYRPGQGVHSRIGTGATLMVLAVFAAVRIYQIIPPGRTFGVLGLQLPASALWAGAVFLAEMALVAYFLVGPDFGGAFLRKKSRSFVDLLIETQLELEKVVWPSRRDLSNSTVIVLLAIVLLGAFILAVDWILSWLLITLKVLPH